MNEALTAFVSHLDAGIPVAAAVLGTILMVWIVRKVIDKRFSGIGDFRFRRQMISLTVGFIGLLALVTVLPVSVSMRNQLLSLIGIIVSAAVALSSTTFVGNTFAGIMLRSIKSFRPGDYIIVGPHSGRVSDRGIFHVEIQTEDRQLTTLPNLFLVTNPVTVLPASGTIVAAEVSIGYDVPHGRVEDALLAAATAAKLEQPFVQLPNLGDYSVTYRVAGLLSEMTEIITARSRLRRAMLDSLHRADVEIMSPAFMNIRSLEGQPQMIPPTVDLNIDQPGVTRNTPEAVVFDKADKAGSVEQLREVHLKMGEQLTTLEQQAANIKDEQKREALEQEIDVLREQRIKLGEFLDESSH